MAPVHPCGEDLDLNVAIPLAAVDFDLNAIRQEGGVGPVFINTQHGHVSLGIADMYLRAKYRLGDLGRIRTAAGLVVRLPTGDINKALGADRVEVGPYLYLSTHFADRVEPQVNVGFNVATVLTAARRSTRSVWPSPR